MFLLRYSLKIQYGASLIVELDLDQEPKSHFLRRAARIASGPRYSGTRRGTERVCVDPGRCIDFLM
jgi:hypothetical protein